MTSSPVILVRNIGKKYRLGSTHEAGAFQYKALRDVIANIPKRIVQRVKNNNHQNPKEFWALESVSFDVQQGEVLGIIGRNGAGKTTLLKIISQITEPTEGEIRIRGRVASLLEVGTGFHPELTGRENIYMNSAILGMTKAETKRKFEEIVAFAEVEKFIDTPVKRYSSGMYVRLAFAVAAHLESEILLVDEVLAVGDFEFQNKCLGKMKDISQGGRTVLFVSHNMATIELLCSRGLLLENGKIGKIGEIKEVTSFYKGSIKKSVSQKNNKFPIINNKYQISIENVEAIVISESKNNLILKIIIEILANKTLNNIGVGIAIYSLDGVLISDVSPSLTKNIIRSVSGYYKISFICNDIGRYLAGGDYFIEIYLTKPKVEVLLHAKDADKFTIPRIDLYGTGIYHDYKLHGYVPLIFNFNAQDKSNIII